MSDAVPQQRRRNIYLTVFALMGLSTLFAGLFARQFIAADRLDPQWLQERGALLFDTARPVSYRPLLDQDGNAFDPGVFQGYWNLLFFGYTYCPDVCPATLATLKQTLAKLEVQQPGHKVRVYLVSVDPERDTPARLAEYLGFFDPRFGGITGHLADIHQFASGLHIAFRKAPQEDGPYLVDHSTQLVLISPQGQHQGYLKAPFSPDKLAEVIQAISQRY